VWEKSSGDDYADGENYLIELSDDILKKGIDLSQAGEIYATMSEDFKDSKTIFTDAGLYWKNKERKQQEDQEKE